MNAILTHTIMASVDHLRELLSELGLSPTFHHKIQIGDEVLVQDERRQSEIVGAERVLRGQPRYEAVVTVTIAGRPRKILVEHRQVVEPRHLPLIFYRMDALTKTVPRAFPVLAAEHLSPRCHESLRAKGLGYVDAAGNAWLKFGTVLIDRKVGGGGPGPRRNTPLESLVARKYSRVLRVLLEGSLRDPEKGWTVQGLREEARVSFRHAWVVLKRLAEQGWVDKKRGGNRLVAPGTLLDFWAERYRWNRHTAHRFYAPARGLQELLEGLWTLPSATRYALTGPAAALLIAPYVTFAVYHIFTGSGIEPFQKALQLRPVETGGANLVLAEPDDEGVFYQTRTVRDVPLACNTQVYLDLRALGGRGKEQAEHLRREVMRF